MEFLSQNSSIIIAGAVVLVALLVLAAVLRAFGPRMSGRRGQRLGISEYLELDKTRRLVLVRRDNVEHLVLIGGGQDVLLEGGIPALPYAPGHAEPAPPPHPVQPPGTARPAPRAAMFGERKPPPLRPAGEPAPLRSRDEPEL